MLKRVFIVLLALLYTVTVFGFGVNVHYCGKTIASVKINSPAQSCKMVLPGSKMKCCKDKVKDAHQGGSASFLGKLLAFDLPKLPFEDFFLSAQKALLEKLFDRGPPDPPAESKITIFIKNCNIRI
jgi:hypothetical protein